MDGEVVSEAQLYEQVIDDFVGLMDSVGLPPIKVRALLEERIAREGKYCDPDTMESAMLTTYERVSRNYGGVHPRIVEEIYEVGKSHWRHSERFGINKENLP